MRCTACSRWWAHTDLPGCVVDQGGPPVHELAQHCMWAQLLCAGYQLLCLSIINLLHTRDHGYAQLATNLQGVVHSCTLNEQEAE